MLSYPIQERARRTPSYSAIVSPNSISSSRYTPYSAPPVRSTLSSNLVNHPRPSTSSQVYNEAPSYRPYFEIDGYGVDQIRDEWLGGGANYQRRVDSEARYLAERARSSVPRPGPTSPQIVPFKRPGRRIQDRRIKQKTPRKTKDDLKIMIDDEVAKSDAKFVRRDEDKVGFANRKAAWELRIRCDAVRRLINRAKEEGSFEDRKQLNSIKGELSRESKRVDALAAEEIYAKHNPRLDTEDGQGFYHICDLHGLYVPEARDYVKRFFETCAIGNQLRAVKIVTGKGNHSEGGVAKLKPAIKKYLDDRADLLSDIDEENEGCIMVRFKLVLSEALGSNLVG